MYIKTETHISFFTRQETIVGIIHENANCTGVAFDPSKSTTRNGSNDMNWNFISFHGIVRLSAFTKYLDKNHKQGKNVCVFIKTCYTISFYNDVVNRWLVGFSSIFSWKLYQHSLGGFFLCVRLIWQIVLKRNLWKYLFRADSV